MSKHKILVSAYACAPPDTAGIGAGEANLGFNLVRELSKHYDLVVITQKEYEQALREHNFCNFAFVEIPLMKFLKKSEITQKIYYYMWQVKAYFKAKKLHKKHNFSLAHHVTYANGWMPSFIGALLPVPFVWGPLGGGQRTPPEFYSEYSFSDLFEEFTRLFFQTIFRLDLFAWLCRKKAKHILVCNKETKKRFFSRQSKKVGFFPVTGLSEEDLRLLGRRSRTKKGKFKVLMAGRMISLKGFGLGIKAFNKFSKRFPNAELVVVGEGLQKRKLLRLAANNPKIRFVGWIERKKLFELMKESDVFLFPSLRDGGGAVVVEAMAAGMPVVCFDLAGPSMLVTQNSGYRIPASTPKKTVMSIAVALHQLASDPSVHKRLSTGARKRAKSFSWKTLSQHVLRVYSSIL